MLLGAEFAIVVAKRSAKTFTTRNWTPLIGLHVGWGLQSVLVQCIHNVVVRSMIQLADFGLLTMPCRQILPKFVMALAQLVIFDCLDANDTRPTIMERGR
jgi:hypothetical protein